MITKQQLAEIKKRESRAIELLAMKHYGWEAGCDAWVEFNKIINMVVQTDIPNLIEALEKAISIIRHLEDQRGCYCCAGLNWKEAKSNACEFLDEFDEQKDRQNGN